MTVYFIGNTYKYETEAVLKLFCPLERFKFVYEERPQKGRDMIIIESGDCLRVYADIDGVNSEITEPTGEETSKERELRLCKMLFTALKEITGIAPEWGCLTGVRPIKVVNGLIGKGFDMDGVCRELSERYFVTRRKGELAYKTAVHQQEALSKLSALEGNAESYSLYISIPFCPSRCSYCSFVSHSIQSKGAKKLIPEYVDMLCREIRELGEILRGGKMPCASVYIGGGTPTSFSAGDLKKIMETVEKNIDISKILEYNVEAGRPDTVTEEKLRVIKGCGATRISVNPQTMNNTVLEKIGRRHTAEQVTECFELARRLGFDNINTDTIAGLPGDTFDSFKDTVERLISLAPESITVHTLTVKRSSDLLVEADKLRPKFSDSGELSAMVNFAFDRLCGAGYAPYYLYRQKNTVGNLENVGYSKAGYEGLYNIYIMEEAQNILACGAGGSTKLIDRKTGKIRRFFNYKYPYEYISRYDEMVKYKGEIAAAAKI
ncbi:MAG: coproporphyrinogen dehydrogenase HemZ [Ruminococcus sp.]|nr:coproporphyrinogen dehydrogenase HemZ [Ruminococcus sp.]